MQDDQQGRSGVVRGTVPTTGPSPRPSRSTSSKPPLNNLPGGVEADPRGSRIGDVTSVRIAPGGLARIERRWIPSRWARTARGGADSVALSSHYASRVRVRAGSEPAAPTREASRIRHRPPPRGCAPSVVAPWRSCSAAPGFAGARRTVCYASFPPPRPFILRYAPFSRTAEGAEA